MPVQSDMGGVSRRNWRSAWLYVSVWMETFAALEFLGTTDGMCFTLFGAEAVHIGRGQHEGYPISKEV